MFAKYTRYHIAAIALTLVGAILSLQMGANMAAQMGFASTIGYALLLLLPDVRIAGFRLDGTPTPEELTRALKSALDEVRGLGEELKTKHANGEKVSVELKEQTDKAMIGVNEMRETLKDLEQKMAQRGREPEREKTYGEQYIESASFKRYKDTGEFGGRVEMKQVTSAAAGGLIVSQRETEIVSLPKQRMIVRDLLPVVEVSTSSVDYPRQLTRTNNAAPVAEGAPKPYSDYTWGEATAPVRTIAHLAKITRQAMDDAPRLRGEIDSEMRYGLGLVEEFQLLYGNGTGQNLNGIVPQATEYAAPAGAPTTNITRIDTIRLAMLQAQLALYPPDGIILNPADWAFIELTKTSEGAYLFANLQGSVTPRLWGLPVVDTPAMALGDFLVGGFRYGATLYDRMKPEVLISSENADDFEKNLLTMRCEERIALAVKRAQAFITGTFDA